MYEDIELHFINVSRLIFCTVITKHWSYDDFTYAVCSKNFKGKFANTDAPIYRRIRDLCLCHTDRSG